MWGFGLRDFLTFAFPFPIVCFFKAELELARLHVLYLVYNKLDNIEKFSKIFKNIEFFIASAAWKKPL